MKNIRQFASVIVGTMIAEFIPLTALGVSSGGGGYTSTQTSTSTSTSTSSAGTPVTTQNASCSTNYLPVGDVSRLQAGGLGKAYLDVATGQLAIALGTPIGIGAQVGANPSIPIAAPAYVLSSANSSSVPALIPLGLNVTPFGVGPQLVVNGSTATIFDPGGQRSYPLGSDGSGNFVPAVLGLSPYRIADKNSAGGYSIYLTGQPNYSYYQVDSSGRPTAKVVNGQTTSFSYGSNGFVGSMVDTYGNTWSLSYTTSGSQTVLSQISGPDGVMGFYYSSGYLTGVNVNGSAIGAITWNSSGQPTQFANSITGDYLSISYSGGYLAQITAMPVSTTFSASYGTTTTVSGPNSATISYQYLLNNGCAFPTQVTRPKSITTITYTAAGSSELASTKTLTLLSPSGGTAATKVTSYSYTNGLPTTIIRGTGSSAQIDTITYNSYGQVTGSTLGGGISYAYDNSGGLTGAAIGANTVSFGLNSNGTISNSTINGVNSSYGYNSNGAVTSVTKAGFTAYVNRNSNGSVSSINLPDGSTKSFNYSLSTGSNASASVTLVDSANNGNSAENTSIGVGATGFIVSGSSPTTSLSQTVTSSGALSSTMSSNGNTTVYSSSPTSKLKTVNGNTVQSATMAGE